MVGLFLVASFGLGRVTLAESGRAEVDLLGVGLSEWADDRVTPDGLALEAWNSEHWNSEHWNLAAERWIAEAERWTSQGDAAGFRMTGWSYALATAALVEANSLQAYQTWPLAISWLADGELRWRDEQDRFRGWLALPEDEPLGALARRVEDALGVSEFLGPPQGLGDPWWGPEPDSTVTASSEQSVSAVARPPVADGSRVALAQEPDVPAGEAAETSLPEDPARPTGEVVVARNEAALELEPTEPDLLPQGRVESQPLEVLAVDLQPPDLPEPEPAGSLLAVVSPSVEAPQAIQTISPPRTALNEADRVLVEAAWAYFERNRRSTFLVDSVAGYPYATLWDVASTMAAVHAANELGLIPAAEATDWLGRLLDSLLGMPLYRDELPNREYDTRDVSIATTGKTKLAGGSGWSALDLGRMLIWLRVIHDVYPSLQSQVATLVASWDFRRLTRDGYLSGALFTGKQELIRQEGRLGYEQYAAEGLALWGHSLPDASDYDRIELGLVDGVEVPYDERNLAFLTSDPFVLGAIELGGINEAFRAVTETIFAVQRARWQRDGTITAAGEDALDRYPWFIYSNVLFEGKAWRAVSHRGREQEGLFGWSAKGALGWWALNQDPGYGTVLREQVQKLIRPGRGVWAGMLDDGSVNRSLNVNTNAVILEIMLFLVRDGRAMVDSEGAEAAR